MSHPMDMVHVCPTCLEANRTYQNNVTQLRTSGCLVPQIHEEHDSENENWSLTVINETGTIDYVLIATVCTVYIIIGDLYT